MKRWRRLAKLLLYALLLGAVGLTLLVWNSRANRRASNEAEALEVLRTLHAALARYAELYPSVGYPASLRQLGWRPGPRSCHNAELVEKPLDFDEFVFRGYQFTYELKQGRGLCRVAGSVPGTRYVISARPWFPAVTGDREFLVSEDGSVRDGAGQELALPEPARADLLGEAYAETDDNADAGIVLTDVIWMGAHTSFMWRVRFDHKAHVEERMIECEYCHHPPRPERLPLSGHFEACSLCHRPDVRIPMRTSIQKAFHDAMATSGLCIDCHAASREQGLQPPLECGECHAVRPHMRTYDQ
jgi:hypothetical protein